jgi:hypothetical protein
MKLIKFIATVALIASSAVMSGGQAAPSGVTQDIATYCPNWPYCRDVEVADEFKLDQSKARIQYLAYCPNWPYCRDVEVTEQIIELRQQKQAEAIRKAV